MTISATMVKELRERTGAGMMECKKALEESGGNINNAVEAMRKSGVARAARKAGRIAAEGVVLVLQSEDEGVSIILEVNCETDFVAKDENFRNFAAAAAKTILDRQPDDPQALANLPLADGTGRTVEEARLQLIAKIGENVGIRRFHIMQISGDFAGCYSHGTRIGVLADIQGGDPELARDVAMHIAASRPLCISEKDVPRELLEQEKDIYAAKAKDSGKPPEIIEKMVTGQLRKFVNEVTLLGQPFVKDPDQAVGKLLAARKAAVLDFVRFEVGEGIEKKTENFAAEVMAQIK